MKCFKCLILLLLSAGALAGGQIDTTFGTTETNPATSCTEIYQLNPTSRGTIGQYYIKTCNGAQKVTCNMKLKCGGLEGGWMQVVDVDMNRDESCPGTWQNVTTPRRLCQGNDAGCSSGHFYMNEITYEHIYGQVVGYQKGSPDAFEYRRSSLDSVYVEGVSITMGSPRQHVWTYAVGLSDDFNYPAWNCPCATYPGPSPPAFVGNDYYCESGDVGTLNSILTTYLTLFGMGMAVLVLMDAVVKLECHGFIRSCLSKWLVILKFAFVKIELMLMKTLPLKKLNFMFAVRHRMKCVHLCPCISSVVMY